MSRSLARVVAMPSYGETQWPDLAVHALLVTTLVPSRIRMAVRENVNKWQGDNHVNKWLTFAYVAISRDLE